jgi:hypothetical protein
MPVGKVLTDELLQLRQNRIDTVLGILAVLVLTLFVAFVLSKYRSERRRSWEQSAEEREFARLIEDSVGAGKLARE